MNDFFISIAASVAAVSVAGITSLILSKSKRHRDKVIEFSTENGKSQKIRVDSFDHEAIKKAIETEISIENVIRSTLREIKRSNGKISIEEGKHADFIAQLGKEIVIIEAKRSIDNLTKDFFKHADKEFKNYHSILVVDQKSSKTPSTFKNRDIKIINFESKVEKFKETFTQEINKLLKIS